MSSVGVPADLPPPDFPSGVVGATVDSGVGSGQRGRALLLLLLVPPFPALLLLVVGERELEGGMDMDGSLLGRGESEGSSDTLG
jgi:hypothetical protein